MSDNSLAKEDWDLEIHESNPVFGLNIKELIRYKDLILLFVKRDFISIYKQTVLGPLWVILQPILTTITFTIIFGNIAGLGTDGIPKPLFYLAGITVWGYFSDCVLKTSDTFIANQNIFGKVYFPRLVVPISIVVTNLIKFGIQLVLFVLVYIYIYFTDSEANIHITSGLFLLPVIVIIMMFLGMSLGLIISAMTTKYRDLRFLIQFGIQLAMYASPIVYPLSEAASNPKNGELYVFLLRLNPMTNVIETFKYAFFGKADMLDLGWLAYSFVLSIVLLLIGLFLFNRVERSFMDTI